ncbi:YppG family protein [Halalkalibacterium halodurans]|jgi:hypothetical protein|uniref:BH2273 protein n=2 Tax=Halalkalibacterium halodurans TaxID=86665 RepID=Q9KAL4_HALH5|nr:YppG family protein [Halalkalibacterium halodurans]MDY7222824.1 YppG family protein [Halalkalibacterium halodurans]MDY7242045.1 YppG family protein [Halalkalibacterium halodurans]MED3647788.1 YppG family protein [Halalkalibacterium halodurans]MED4080944.1 YppG family protein [Halalkalibacterium halodurans]MED4085127.1 YppG family protein [Halalkalibacterium halodurans]
MYNLHPRQTWSQGAYYQQPFQHSTWPNHPQPTSSGWGQMYTSTGPSFPPPFYPNYFSQQKPKASPWKAAFTNQDGTFDINKTFQTVDQVVKTVNQVTPLVKSVGSIFIK